MWEALDAVAQIEAPVLEALTVVADMRSYIWLAWMVSDALFPGLRSLVVEGPINSEDGDLLRREVGNAALWTVMNQLGLSNVTFR